MTKLFDSRIPMAYEHVSDFLSREPKTNTQVRKCCKCCESILNFVSRCEFNYSICFNHNRNTKYLQFNYIFCDFLKKFYLRRILKKVRGTFIFGLCLLSVIRLPVTMSAPIERPSQRKVPALPSWEHPSGVLPQDDQYGDYSQPNIEYDLIERIYINSGRGLGWARMLRNKFIPHTYKKNVSEHHLQWRMKSYDWLPNLEKNISKELGENANDTHVQNMNLDQALLTFYEYLQRIAVGLHQVVLEQTDKIFYEDFRITYNELVVTLEEIRNAMTVRNIKPIVVITSGIKNDTLEFTDESKLNLRDWIILREYINVFEYCHQVFRHLLSQRP